MHLGIIDFLFSCFQIYEIFSRCFSTFFFFFLAKSLVFTLLLCGFVCFSSLTHKSSMRDPTKAKAGPPEKPAGVIRPDTKGRGTSDHHGEICSLNKSAVCL